MDGQNDWQNQGGQADPNAGQNPTGDQGWQQPTTPPAADPGVTTPPPAQPEPEAPAGGDIGGGQPTWTPPTQPEPEAPAAEPEAPVGGDAPAQPASWDPNTGNDNGGQGTGQGAV
ncbi:MAG: hypothetical protein HYV38_00985 [Candidatus Levybacteria bacterium]|nr:hypothetical protein [Candidatus Levybacteria bacterium]MBI2420641.1 hypothetical protein [Candidatus Levybacteria bacterium]